MTTTAAEPRLSRAATMVRDLTRDQKTKTGELDLALLKLPGPRATLKRCLGLEADDRRWDRAWQHLVEYVPERADSAEERAFVAVAAMICAQNPSARKDDLDEHRPPATAKLGASMAIGVAQHRWSSKDAALSRLILLGRQNLGGLHRLLPRTVLHLRSLGVPIAWAALVDDLAAWPRYRREITKRWIQDYHRTLHRIETERARNDADESETT
ncbi:type I-E CRISPR-associated protein Cse2/CasB [Natronoglycomyces albus]|uniref:Type I-E CRISPR-associated protein Cse2/CasB n=1 Tax=Natronoglycomyces albus TaxID=2811108 RepID=A0A895XVH7_9ACTN|nr:type I-E CRISPR-associated protein Cse2/CasB [Natronoglycomyces albus]QSB06526.1 type I-E CRISPR-associated protein Cse2/CasB [Natronoglycomyces albus]